MEIMGDVAQRSLMVLTIKNEGPTVATNIRATFSK